MPIVTFKTTINGAAVVAVVVVALDGGGGGSLRDCRDEAGRLVRVDYSDIIDLIDEGVRRYIARAAIFHASAAVVAEG